MEGSIMPLPERINAIMAKHSCSKSDIARVAGVKPPSVSDWVNGKTRTLKAESALKLAKYYRLNMQWLTSGVGLMEPESDESVAMEHTAQNSEERRILEDFRNTPRFLHPFLLSLIGSLSALGSSCQAEDRVRQTAMASIGKSMARLVEAVISLRRERDVS